VRARTNRLPLGAAALAGTSFPLDREAVAKALRMDGVCQNSIDAVSDRDFAIEFTAAASLAMLHVSRLSEEIVIWMSQSFGFVELADRFCTGSSIMPQKKNPDVAELARGKTGRVVGHLMGLLHAHEGPAARLQQGQPGRQGAALRQRRHAEGHAARLRRAGARHHGQGRGDGARGKLGYATATDLADALVNKGVPFRDAHEAVARVVKHAMSEGVDLSELPLAVLQSFHPAIGADVQSVLTLKGSLASRNVLGGTAPEQVRAQIARHRARLGKPQRNAISPPPAS
jgi:argininosuccinate lyase